MIDYQKYDAVGLATLVKENKITPTELVEEAIKQIKTKNTALNAVVRLRKKEAMDEALSVDLTLPFAGVPILLKDLGQDILGELNTAGAKLLQNYRSDVDSHYTKKIKEAGFIIIGQTNSPEFGFKNITDPKLFGNTNNPHDQSRSPGGSSGGSAAAVASKMVPIAGSSDGGGSIRIPASFTGLVGLKTTRGKTPVGPNKGRSWQGAAVDFALSRTVRDTAAFLDIMETEQLSSAFFCPKYKKGYLNLIDKPIEKPLKIAYSTTSPVGSSVSKDAILAVENTVEYLRKQGYVVEKVDVLVDGNALIHSYFLMNGGETAAMMENLAASMGREVVREDVELMTWAIYQMGTNVSAATYSRAIHQWDLAAESMSKLFETYDLYLTPSTADVAPKHDDLTLDEALIYKLETIQGRQPDEQIALIHEMFKDSLALTPFTQLANLTGGPAISLPLHLTADELPLGVQFQSEKGREDLLILVASFFERSPLWKGVL